MLKKYMLQWGRVVKDAEMYLRCRLDGKPFELQWGRVVKDAEMMYGRFWRSKRSLLQWGRVVKDAEMAPVPNVCCADSYDSRIERSI
jgi:hypothetical protein